MTAESTFHAEHEKQGQDAIWWWPSIKTCIQAMRQDSSHDHFEACQAGKAQKPCLNATTLPGFLCLEGWLAAHAPVVPNQLLEAEPAELVEFSL